MEGAEKIKGDGVAKERGIPLEAIECVKKELKKKQEESKDEFFKKLDLDQLKPEALMILNAAVERFQTPFPAEIKRKAVAMASESAFYPEDFSGPEERLDYIKGVIVRYPNAFYTEERDF